VQLISWKVGNKESVLNDNSLKADFAAFGAAPYDEAFEALPDGFNVA